MKSTTRSPRMDSAQPNCRRPCASLIAIAALAVAGCGSSSGPTGPAPDFATALHGAPAPLAALYRQTAYGGHPAVLPGGIGALQGELAKLHGLPVVINVWGSWCAPCRQEFPYLQRASARFGKRVAFLGVDTQDQTGAASTFLKEDPLPYPSYSDPAAEVKSTYHLVGLPATVIYDSAGKVVQTHQGPYTSAAALYADVQHYAQ